MRKIRLIFHVSLNYKEGVSVSDYQGACLHSSPVASFAIGRKTYEKNLAYSSRVTLSRIGHDQMSVAEASANRPA